MIPGTVYTVAAGENSIQLSTPANVPVATAIGKVPPGFLCFLLHPGYYQDQYDRVGNQNVLNAAKTDNANNVLAQIGKLNQPCARTDDQSSSMWPVAIGKTGPLTLATGSVQQPNYGGFWKLRKKFASAGIALRPNCIQYAPPPFLGVGSHSTFPNPADFAAYCSVVLQSEDLYATQNNLPKPTSIDVGNEWNQSYWCENTPPGGAQVTCAHGDGNAADYFKLTYVALHAVDPSINVIGPGACDGGSHCYNLFAYFQNLIANGCHIGTCWDTVAVHYFGWPGYDPTAPQDPNNMGGPFAYKRVQQEFASAGFAKPNIIIDEYGYAADDESVGIDSRIQSLWETQYINALLADPTVVGLTNASACNGDDGKIGTAFGSTGLMIPDATGQCQTGPLYSVFQSFTGAQ
jgi:hypothetical protein